VNIIGTPLLGVMIIETKFLAIIELPFLQINHSWSTRGVPRGLRLEHNRPKESW
jgi:dTDP-4-dehydrorhamnose 3,5-epimerase-like enzyme